MAATLRTKNNVVVDQTACSALDSFARDTTQEAHKQTPSLCGQIFDGYIVAQATISGGPLDTVDVSVSADHA